MIVFHNPGLLDLTAVRLFGASVKEGSNPIGMFGTGLKYALAVALRNGCRVQIVLSGYDSYETYQILAQPTTLRGQDFQEVVMVDDEAAGTVTPLGFTTALGKGWELWQAYREFYCNALDEGGTASVGPDHPVPEGSWTAIYVDNCREFDSIHAMRSRWFIDRQEEPLWRGEDLEVYAGPSDSVYYRGVCVGKLPKESIFRINLTSPQELTEDRTLKYSWIVQSRMASAVASEMPGSLFRRVALAPFDSYEASLDVETYGMSVKLSEEAMRIIPEIQNDPRFNRTLKTKFLQQRNGDTGPEPRAATGSEERTITRALAVLRASGLAAIDRGDVFVTSDVPPGVLGCLHGKRLFVTDQVLHQGAKMVAGTIFEEWLHRERHVFDETRAMQNALVDLLMTMAERSSGEQF